MKQKLSIPVLIFGIIAGLYSCGGTSTSADNSASAPIANGAASNSASQATEAPAATIDVNAKSDDKGVGKFTNVPVGPLNKEMAEKGEKLFGMKCSACHKTTDQKVVGPGLKGITAIRTPEWIMNMITNPAEMTQKDPIAKVLLEQNLTQMSVQVTDDEARQIMEYLRENDKEQ